MKNNKKYDSWYIPGKFFNQDYLNLYKKFLTKKRTRKEVDFIEEVLNLKKGMNILDLACGYGRHAIELAKRGYKVTGQDVNGFFLEEAEKEAKKEKINITWIEGDMRKIPYKNEFDVVLSLFTSFGYLETDDDHQEVISELAKALKKNGLFFLDVHNREEFIRHSSFKEKKKLPDGSVMVIKQDFDFITGKINECRTWIKKNQKDEEYFLSFRQFTLIELINMCQKSGLIFRESFGDYQGKPLILDSRRSILITKKSN